MKTTNLYYNNYLSKCDLINKYNYTNLYDISIIKDIILEFPIIQLQSLLNNSINSKNMFFQTYFIFYILFYFKPYINYKSIKHLPRNYSLKFKLSNKFQVENFIHLFCIYFSSNNFLNFFLNFNNLSKKKKKETQLFSSKSQYKKITSIKNISLIKLLKKQLNINLKIPAFCFYKLNIYTSFFFSKY